MMEIDKHTEANRRLWDELVDIHAKSDFYDLDGFRKGAITNGDIERAEVGDVAGKRLLHLLCHFGMDTLSWERLGAVATGVDISEKAIAAARALASDCGLEAEFVCCDVTDARSFVDGPFDIVFMSWGTLVWIGDLPKLARMIESLLTPGGFFYVIDGHPMAQAVDESWTRDSGPAQLVLDYESGDAPSSYEWGSDYADPAMRPENQQAYEWSHGLGRIVTSFAEAGLSIDFLHEHDKVAWRMISGLVDNGGVWWGMPDGQPQLPLSYSLKATKR